MTSTERRAILLAGILIVIVFAFLAGFLLSDCRWFQPPKDAMLDFLGSIVSRIRGLFGR